MDIIAGVLSVAALVAAWLYAVKQLSTMHALMRHSLGALVGLVAMFVVVLMFVFIGVFAPKGQNAAATNNTVSPSEALLESLTTPAKTPATPDS